MKILKLPERRTIVFTTEENECWINDGELNRNVRRNGLFGRINRQLITLPVIVDTESELKSNVKHRDQVTAHVVVIASTHGQEGLAGYIKFDSIEGRGCYSIKPHINYIEL